MKGVYHVLKCSCNAFDDSANIEDRSLQGGGGGGQWTSLQFEKKYF